MKKIKLLITSAALLVGGLLASSSNNIMKANAADIDLTNCKYEKIDSVEALSDGNYIFGYDVNFDEKTSLIKSGNFLGSFGENIFQRTTELNGAEIINIKKDSSNGYYTLQIGEQYVEYHGSSNKVYLENDGNIYWTPVLKDGSFHFQNIEKDSKGKDRFLEYNKNSGQERFACYNGTQESFDLFKIIENQINDPNNFFDMSKTSTSLKLSGHGNREFNENIVFNNIDFGENKQTKYSPNEMVEAMGLDSSAWTISGTDVELLMYNGFKGEIQFYKDGYIEITNNESKINSFTLTDLSLTLSNDLIVVDENDNEVKGTENGNGTTFTFSGDGTRKFKITLTGRDSLYATGSMQLYCKGSATITGAGIRFGTNIPVNLYDENAHYGVIVAQASSLGGAALDSYLGLESDISLDGFKHDLETMEVKYYDSGKLIPAYVMNINDTEAATPEEANYVQYALVLNGLENNLLDEEFAAVCYMASSDGTFHIMSEARHSVRSVAEAYLADDKIMSSLTNNSIALLNAVVA